MWDQENLRAVNTGIGGNSESQRAASYGVLCFRSCVWNFRRERRGIEVPEYLQCALESDVRLVLESACSVQQSGWIEVRVHRPYLNKDKMERLREVIIGDVAKVVLVIKYLMPSFFFEVPTTVASRPRRGTCSPHQSSYQS